MTDIEIAQSNLESAKFNWTWIKRHAQNPSILSIVEAEEDIKKWERVIERLKPLVKIPSDVLIP